MALLLSGCATSQPDIKSDEPAKLPADRVAEQPGNPVGASIIVPDSAYHKVATDFSIILSQLAEFPPLQTTLAIDSTSYADEGFGRALQNALIAQGYRIGDANAHSIDSILSYRVDHDASLSSTDNSGQVVTFQLSLKDLGLRRRYALDSSNGRIKPLAPMQARGFDASFLVSDDSLFEHQAMNAMGKIEPALGSAIGTQAESSADAESPSLDDTGQPLQVAVVDSLLVRESEQNYRELGKSFYEAVFEEYALVDERVIGFQGSSANLEQNGRQRLSAMLGKFSSATDIVSIIGSAHGGAGSVEQLRKLARDRADEVRNELEGLGVPASKILVEASWSREDYDTVLPRSAAVVALMRPQP